jgi:murein DD-endopeptidase MepM/ murein hydrolase activator NlpD
MNLPLATLPLVVLGIAVFAVCLPESADPEKRHYACRAQETNWENSPYVLPYPIGKSYRVNQGNCSGHGHNNFWNHGYDFAMDIGTPVSAAREGQVGWAKDGCQDGNYGCANLITIKHADGTVALYSHLSKSGVLVHPGEQVAAGQIIGKSGNTGNTGGHPHLHFSVHPCNELPGLPNAGACPSIPVNFRNTEENRAGLLPIRAYIAQPSRGG